jgi:hypothetical protein
MMLIPRTRLREFPSRSSLLLLDDTVCLRSVSDWSPICNPRAQPARRFVGCLRNEIRRRSCSPSCDGACLQVNECPPEKIDKRIEEMRRAVPATRDAAVIV